MTPRLVAITRESKLRDGYQERVIYGRRVLLYLYWEAHYVSESETFVQDFCIEWDNGDKRYIHDFDEAVKEFARLEREFVIEEMTRALLGPQDTTKIRKPPRF